MDAFGDGGLDLSVGFKARILGSHHACTSSVTGLLTTWEGQARVRSQVPVLHPADSSP